MRYPAPDRIRGLALLGILVVNLGFMVGPIGLVLEPPSGQSVFSERAGWWLLRLAFESKFMALFALLFGASVMLAGGDQKRHEARMLRLFPIGVVHGLLLFFGDILHAYAVWGFPLARLRRVQGKWLLLFGGIAFCWYLGVTAAVHSFEVEESGVPNFGPSWFRLASASADPSDPGFIALESEVVRAGPSVDSTLYRMVVFTYVGIKGVFQTGWRVFALFLLGLWLTRSGLWDAPGRFRLICWGIPIGLLLEVVAIQGMSLGTPYAIWTTVTHELGSVLLSLGLFVSLAHWRGEARCLTRHIQAAGRMALTVYLLQSVVMFALAHSGCWGEIDRCALFGLAIVIWLGCIFFCERWLRRYPTGPIEHFWRCWADGSCGQHASVTKDL
ncbi:MAG TPA: hypothetical protein DEQ73_04740 [Phycisphaerales bacterium]|nr:MAG: DUF418 domain-containing protein [Phycisphaera sp. TMED24]HCD29894.1 hypothetical protein [Phycisphaerales bacterium]